VTAQVPDHESSTELCILLKSFLQKAGLLDQETFNACPAKTELAQAFIAKQPELFEYCSNTETQSAIQQAIGDVSTAVSEPARRPAALKDSGNRLFQAGDTRAAVVHWRAAVRLQSGVGNSAVPRLLDTRADVWRPVRSPHP
jgi:hypothetical protein